MMRPICVWIQGRSLLPELLPAQLLLVILHLETNGRAKTKNRPWNDIQGNRLPRGSGHHPAKTPARRRFNPNPNQGTILTLICDIKQLQNRTGQTMSSPALIYRSTHAYAKNQTDSRYQSYSHMTLGCVWRMVSVSVTHTKENWMISAGFLQVSNITKQ